MIAYPELSASDSPWCSTEAQTPDTFRLVRYRTAYYQMIGYLDRLGRWMASDGMQESLPVELWQELKP
jgi:hypothetical protein